MRTFLAAVMSFALTLSGCVSVYKGPTPNLNLRGAAAENEIKKYEFQEGFWFQGHNSFLMGSGAEMKPYFVSSLKPVIVPVSPAAWSMTEKTKFWKVVQLSTLVAAIAILVAAITDGDGDFFSKDQTIAYYSLLGVSIGSGMMRAYWMAEAAEQYNRDLRSRFTPALGFNFSFE